MRGSARETFLDGNSTTPVDPRVARAICAAYTRLLGNPSSTHLFGWRAKNLLEKARGNVAQLLNAQSDEIYFVSSVTIGLNIAIQGLIGRPLSRHRRIAASRTEHKSIVSLVRYACSKSKFEWIELELDRFGAVIPESAGEAARRGVDLICISHGNGETGCLNDLDLIVDEVRRLAPLVFDVSQTAAYVDLASATAADCLIISGHKLYGPRGTAAFYKRRQLELAPLLIGAGQEGGVVPGTEDVPGAIALGVAAQIAWRERDQRREHVNALRDQFWKILTDRVPDVELNGHPIKRVPGNLSITVPNVPAELIMRRLPHLGLSMASACAGGGESQVLKALGFSKARIACTFRVGFNVFNTYDEVEKAGLDISAVILGLHRRG